MSLEEAGNCFIGVTEIQIVRKRVAVAESPARERTEVLNITLAVMRAKLSSRVCSSSVLTSSRCHCSQLGLSVTEGKDDLSGCRVGERDTQGKVHDFQAVNP